MNNEITVNEFFDVLAETDNLIQYFPDGFDFGIDPYDPIIEDLINLLNKIKKSEEIFENKNFIRILIEGIDRHVTVKSRYNLYERLNSIYDVVDKESKEHIRVAKLALEDINIYPGFVGIVNQLFQRQLFKILLDERYQEKSTTNSILPALIEKVKKNPAPKVINEIIKFGEDTLHPIESVFFENDFDINEVENLLEILFRIPCYHSAWLLTEIYLANDLDLESLEKFNRRVSKSKILPFMAIHLLNEIDKNDTDFFDKWKVYDLLVAVKEHRVFKYLRKEMLESDYWSSIPQKDDLELAEEFYNDITNWLIEIGDRRAVPVFIKIIHEGSRMGFFEKVLNAIRNAIRKSIWYEEIEKGLRLLKEGETVFIKKGDDLQDILKKKTQNYHDFHSLIEGKSPTLSDLNERLKIEQTRWNEAYHEELDGLRPIDIPVPRIKINLMQRMTGEFQSKIESQTDSDMNEVMKSYKEFQSNWMITPLSDYNGKIPLVMMIKEQSKLSNTYALKENFKRYKENTINSLYSEAVELFENGDFTDTKKRVDTILQIEPTHPFAKRLKEMVESKS